MSAFPNLQPLGDNVSDVVILSDQAHHIHLVSSHARSESSAWIESILRRCFDCSVAFVALALAAPAMGVVALLVRLSSPGPVLFRQERAGQYRKAFTLYKFRSMRADGSGPALTVDGDPRITRVGAFLRRYKLDELPQLLNVLKGDIGLVGPRPKLPHLEALDLPYRPGMTGVATLAFRNEEKILAEIRDSHVDSFYDTCIKPRKAQLDRDYMRTATLWTDLRVLWQTACSCLLRSDSLPADEAETLRRLATAWSSIPTASTDASGSNLICMANYFARVELRGGQTPDGFRKLDEALERHGFSRFSHHAVRAESSNAAFYFSANRVDDLRAIAGTVKLCANRTGCGNEVLVIKSAGSRFYFGGSQ